MQAPTIWVVGSLNADLIQHIDRLPSAGETVPGGELETFPGGKGANQAYAAAHLGGYTRMLGNVGQDQFGELLINSLRSVGVDTTGVKRIDTATGAASIFVFPDGDNAIVISSGANAQLSPADIRSRLSEIGRSDVLLCQLESPVEAVREALSLAKAAGATTILDPAPANQFDIDVLPSVDVLTPNESELCSILGWSDFDTVDEAALKDAGNQLHSKGVATVVLKLGAKGFYYSNADASKMVSGFKVDVLDSTAAGDTFNGALAVKLLEGHSIEEALVFSNAAAALSVTRPGAQTSIPNRRETEEFCSKFRTSQ